MKVSIAAGGYSHLALVASCNRDDGLDVRFEAHEPSHIFPRMQRDQAWDVAETSLATTYIRADQGDRRFVPLAVFPSRAFRHSSLYAPCSGGPQDAAGLRGARVGILRYAMTTGVWVRDMLAQQYGVEPGSMRWFVGEDSPHPASVEPRVVAGAAALERMLLEGELDCLISGRPPAAYAAGRLRRLFPDFGAEEQAYYARTGVFPIMHVMVVTRGFADRNPGALSLLARRFDAAKRDAVEALLNFDVSTHPLPWLPAYVEDARRRIGGDLWPYGVEANRATLVAFGNALASEGLTSRALAPEEVFVDA